MNVSILILSQSNYILIRSGVLLVFFFKQVESLESIQWALDVLSSYACVNALLFGRGFVRVALHAILKRIGEKPASCEIKANYRGN